MLTCDEPSRHELIPLAREYGDCLWWSRLLELYDVLPDDTTAEERVSLAAHLLPRGLEIDLCCGGCGERKSARVHAPDYDSDTGPCEYQAEGQAWLVLEVA